MAGVCTLDVNGQSSCGTGGYSGPQPGDPNMDTLLLTATPAYGGIDVEWTYPSINPNAVAYTIIYRSLLPDPESAVVLRFAQGNFYFDAIPQNIRYYYWIRVVSIYGTQGELIGPAGATARARIEQTIEELTGKIDSGVLAQSLKAEIDRIELNALGITAEMLARAENDDALGIRIDEISAFTGETRALLQEEVLARTSANEAFVSTVNTLYATVNGNIAAVQQQVTAQATDLAALASKVDTLEVEVGENLASAMQQIQVNIDTIDGKLVAIGARWTAQVNVNGLIGGFGVYNDGQLVEAGFDVDRFWIGRTDANKRKPFIVENDVVYIDEAAINSLTFSKLRDESGTFIVADGKLKADYIDANNLVTRQAQSSNYIPNLQGWSFNADGTFEMNGNAPGLGRLRITQNGLYIYHPNGVLGVDLSISS